MANLFPAGYEDEIIEAAELIKNKAIGYKPSIYFDDTDLSRDGQNRIIRATGIEAWEQWCKKCLTTERYKHLAYPTDFGIEIEPALHAETRDKAESILIKEITEALNADPYGRTAYVKDISFDWSIAPDSVLVDVEVVGIEDVTIDFTVKIGGGNSG